MARVASFSIAMLSAAMSSLLFGAPTFAEEASPSPTNTPEAGVSLLVFPGELPEPGGRDRVTELDFVLGGGQRADRVLRVRGSLDGASNISFQILDARIVNDRLELVNRLSPISAWVAFSKNNFELPAGEVAEVGFEISPPSNVGNSINYAFVVVRSELASPPATDNTEGGAVVSAVAQYAMSLTAVTGDADFVRVKFDVTDVGPILAGDQKYLRVFIDNQSQFPISPNISIQLASRDFSTLRFGPFEGKSPEIPRLSKIAIDVPISAEVIDGNYRILVEATEGINTQRREFEKELIFAEANYSDFVFPWYEVILAALALGFVILLLLLVRSNRRAKRALRGNAAAEESRAFLESLSEPPPANPDSPDQPPRPN